MTPTLPEYFAFCAFLVGCGHVLGWIARGFEVDALKNGMELKLRRHKDAIADGLSHLKTMQTLQHRVFHMEVEIKRNRQRLAKFSPMSRKRNEKGLFVKDGA